jgi:hypothetical protein
MATTTNYAWTTPDNSGLVKNGAQDIRTLGSSVDTSLWNVGYGQAGKNKIINGDFGIWQRGTSFTNPAQGAYTADRWRINFAGATAPTTATLSQQTFTPGTAPVAGYESQYFWRYAVTTKGGSATYFETKPRIEDVRTFAGQTATYSFYAKADSARTLGIYLEQGFGSGGSSAVNTSIVSVSVTTAWTRYSVTISVPSVSGKTIGAGSYLSPAIRLDMADGMTLDLWGMQLEAGSTATAFQTATGTIQGELAACQRYYIRLGGNAAYETLGTSYNVSTTSMKAIIGLPVSMRVIPTSIESSTLCIQDSNDGISATLTSVVLANAGTQQIRIAATGSSLTDNSPGTLLTNNSTSGYIAFSAEL